MRSFTRIILVMAVAVLVSFSPVVANDGHGGIDIDCFPFICN